MTFVSYAFLVLFAVVFGLNLALTGRARSWMLLLASFVFYGWWDWRFLGLLVLSSVIDFVAARSIDRAHDAGRHAAAVGWLRVSLVANLGLLGFFKYFGFFVQSATAALAALGVHVEPLVLRVVLPVGISFYTFQTMSYTIDVYRRSLRPARRLDDFMLFVSFFPQLVAGPIERASHLLPQIERLTRPTADGITRGLELMLVGFLFKMVVGDNMAPFVNTVFRDPDAGGAAVAAGSVAFALQIYGDFAGYSMIAVGSARVLGFDIQPNFRSPYFSRSPSEFWQRWHISLSSWLRDYLYVPLGGNRGTAFKTYRNLALTMLLGGLWHGASWNFVIWGAFHGVLLIAYRVLGDRSRATHPDGHPAPLGRRLASGALFFALTCYGWMLFRADSSAQIARYTIALCSDWRLAEVDPWALSRLLIYAAPMLALDGLRLRAGTEEPWTRWPRVVRVVLAVVVFYLIVLLGTPATADFIYFQF